MRPIESFGDAPEDPPVWSRKIWIRENQPASGRNDRENLIQRRLRLLKVLDGFHQQADVEEIFLILQTVDVANAGMGFRKGTLYEIHRCAALVHTVKVFLRQSFAARKFVQEKPLAAPKFEQLHLAC